MAQQPNAPVRTVHARIVGRVQGVGFRAWVDVEARRLRLDGWVRNRRDGTVEAVFGGPLDAVDEMMRRCARGPTLAQVSEVEIIAEGIAVDPGFRVERTV